MAIADHSLMETTKNRQRRLRTTKEHQLTRPSHRLLDIIVTLVVSLSVCLRGTRRGNEKRLRCRIPETRIQSSRIRTLFCSGRSARPPFSPNPFEAPRGQQPQRTDARSSMAVCLWRAARCASLCGDHFARMQLPETGIPGDERGRARCQSAPVDDSCSPLIHPSPLVGASVLPQSQAAQHQKACEAGCRMAHPTGCTGWARGMAVRDWLPACAPQGRVCKVRRRSGRWCGCAAACPLSMAPPGHARCGLGPPGRASNQAWHGSRWHAAIPTLANHRR